jgi:hypothetical protein
LQQLDWQYEQHQQQQQRPPPSLHPDNLLAPPMPIGLRVGLFGLAIVTVLGFSKGFFVVVLGSMWLGIKLVDAFLTTVAPQGFLTNTFLIVGFDFVNVTGFLVPGCPVTVDFCWLVCAGVTIQHWGEALQAVDTVPPKKLGNAHEHTPVPAVFGWVLTQIYNAAAAAAMYANTFISNLC